MKWHRIPDGGWLQGRPGYETEDGKWFCAQDYDSDDSAKISWFLHKEDVGFIQAFDTLTQAKEYVG